MKIHGNARLLPRQRALLCERVRRQGWTIKVASASMGVSERTTYRWFARWDAEMAMTDRSSAPRSRPSRTPRQVEELIEVLRRRRWTAPRIAAELGMPCSTVCAVLARLGLNRLWRLEPPNPPTATAAAILVSSSTSTSRSSESSTGPAKPCSDRCPTSTVASAGSTAMWPSTTRLDRVRRDPRRRKRRNLRRLPASSRRLVRRPRDQRPASHDRQRLRLPLPSPHRRVRRPPHPSPAHPAIPASDQRQSGAIHPNPATRMGLRHRLSRLTPTTTGTAALARLLQQATTTRSPRPQAAHQPHRLTNVIGIYI